MVKEPVKPRHPEKADLPISVTEFPIVNEPVKPLHPEKAYSPILVTLSKILMLSSLLHPEKAPAPSKSVNPALDKEAVRVISNMPKWKPGTLEGKAVRVKYTMPVTFRLQ